MDTIVAISSPPGIGAIGVIRLSGPQSHEIGLKLSGLEREKLKYRHVYHVQLKDENGNPIDDATIVFYRSPSSYTGEDMVEIFCHSGPAVLSTLIDACINHGARPAEPGEFTLRAFKNGKMDLAQVEAVADIIDASSRVSLQAALNVREGKLSKLINELRDKLLFLISETEAEIDFEEEELLEMTDVEERLLVLDELIDRIEELIRKGRQGVYIREGIRVALAGPPNAGKSSLMNAFAQRERSIVTPEPGTTRDIVEEKVLMKGLPAVVVDTAGLREAENIAEAEGVKRAQQAIEEADIVLLVIDGTRIPDDETIAAVQKLPLDKTIVLLNKSDLGLKLNRETFTLMLEEVEKRAEKAGKQQHIFEDRAGFVESEKRRCSNVSLVKTLDVFEVSAKTGSGLDKVVERIVSRVFSEGIPPVENLLVANRRHIFHLENALVALKEARIKLAEQKQMSTQEGETDKEFGSLEVAAFLLKEAAFELARIIGLVTTDEILDEIFSRFCIGK